jgi:hypothetical protein
VIALHLSDPRESELPAVGLMALLDPETGERMVVDTSDPAVRRRLAGGALAPAIFQRTGVDALALSTVESYERPLSAFFKTRERRR